MSTSADRTRFVPTVRELLGQVGSSAVDPIDWLMGEHWAELDLGRTSRLSLLRRAEHDLAELDGRGGGSGRNGGVSRSRASLAALTRYPEAMVKLVRSGGTTDVRGMRGQLNYLAKDGTVDIEASERFSGAVLSGSLLDDVLSDWSQAASRNATADLTSHFVVSFPIGTDELRAYRAARAWAEAMFDAGTYGDTFDYYTAFHTDTLHPHMHVVVSRRGLDHGSWLKISKRGPIDYDELRHVQVEMAAREGILLQATPRHARALYERPPSDERQRIQLRTGTTPPDHVPTAYDIAASATQTLVQARSVQADADLIRTRDRAVAAVLDAVAADLRSGDGLYGHRTGTRRTFEPDNIQRAMEAIMSNRDELARNIERVDAELDAIPDRSERAPLEREASRLKGRAADLLPGRVELRDWRCGGDAPAYRGFDTDEPKGGREREIHDRTTREAERIANEAGFDGKVIASRYAGEGASRALAERWGRDEVDTFRNSRPIGFASNPERLEEAANDAYTSVHRQIASLFTAARNELAELDRKRATLRERASEHSGRNVGRRSDGDDGFAHTVREVLSADEVRQLERGDAGGLSSVSENADERRSIAKRFLETEARMATETRREALQRAAERIDEMDQPKRSRNQETDRIAASDRDGGAPSKTGRDRDCEKGRGLDL